MNKMFLVNLALAVTASSAYAGAHRDYSFRCITLDSESKYTAIRSDVSDSGKVSYLIDGSPTAADKVKLWVNPVAPDSIMADILDSNNKLSKRVSCQVTRLE
ncbi:MAG: hypothetical protein V4736_11495 [Bdellovibrionota bacterium]